MSLHHLAFLDVNPVNVVKALRRAGMRPNPPTPHLTNGFAVLLGNRAGSVIVSQAPWDGVEWIHASIAWDDRTPSYEDLCTLKAGVFGPGGWAYQVFASSERHVNIHAHALHLWGRADGGAVLPDFGQWGTI